MNVLRLANRKSALALWRAEYVKQQLELQYSGIRVELVTITSQGDRCLDAPLAKILNDIL